MNTLREVWDAMMRNKMRVTATGIAVASGIFLLIVLLGAGNGIIHTMEQNSQGLNLDAINIWPGMTSKPWNGLKEGRSIQLKDDDRKALEKQYDDVVLSSSAQLEKTETANVGHKHTTVSLMGVFPSYTEFENIQILRGRFLNDIDLRERRRVVVIDEKAETALFGKNANAVGRDIRVGQSMYRVVGVQKNDFAFSNNNFYAPFTTVQGIYGGKQEIGNITLKARPGSTEQQLEELTEGIRYTLGTRHEFDPTDRRAVWIWNSAEDNASMNQAKGILNTSFWILGLLTLLSGIVGVSNIMLISVKERTHEFGIRRAIGARPWNIIRMVMLESVLITTAFGYIGMFFGIVFCEWMDQSVGSTVVDIGVFQQRVFIDPTVDLGTCLQATLVMIISGALAGFFPARRAAQVKPIEALRG